jgi:hypothetical protein
MDLSLHRLIRRGQDDLDSKSTSNGVPESKRPFIATRKTKITAFRNVTIQPVFTLRPKASWCTGFSRPPLKSAGVPALAGPALKIPNPLKKPKAISQSDPPTPATFPSVPIREIRGQKIVGVPASAGRPENPQPIQKAPHSPSVPIREIRGQKKSLVYRLQPAALKIPYLFKKRHSPIRAHPRNPWSTK